MINLTHTMGNTVCDLNFFFFSLDYSIDETDLKEIHTKFVEHNLNLLEVHMLFNVILKTRCLLFAHQLFVRV